MKYTNRKSVIDGIEFDSRIELKRYVYLYRFLNEGRISNLELQKPFSLEGDEDTREWKGKRYIADFYYNYRGKDVIEDVKCSFTSRDKIFRARKERMKELGHYIQEIFPVHIPFLVLPRSIKHKQRLGRQKLLMKESFKREAQCY